MRRGFLKGTQHDPVQRRTSMVVGGPILTEWSGDLARKLLLVQHDLQKQDSEASRECCGEAISPFYFGQELRREKTPILGVSETRVTMVSYAMTEKDESSIFDMLTFRLILDKRREGADNGGYDWGR